MSQYTRLLTPLALTAVMVTGLSAASELQGRVVLDGSSTVFPVAEAAAAGFREHFPNVDVTVAVSGTGGGFKRFTVGETDISNASRPIKAKEYKAAKGNKVDFIEIPAALDGLSVVINKENTWVESLTVEQLQKIYLDTDTAKTWADLDASWPAEPIKVYSPGTDSGTFDYFREVTIGKSEASFRSDMSTSEDDNFLVTGVSGNPYAIGYFGAAYYFENQEIIKAVPIVNPDTGAAVLPEPANVIDGSYAPLSRPLFMYVNKTSLRRPEVRKFVEYFLENSASMATKVGYVALPDEVAATAAEFVKKRKAGTTYLTPEFEKREGGLTAVYTAEHLLND